MPNPKLIRITTVPLSLQFLLKGQLAFMQQHFEVVAVSSGPQSELDEVGQREGVNTVLVPMTRAITPFQDLKVLWQLYWLFKKEQPHIIHTHTPKAGTVGMLAAWLAGVPLRFHTVAGLPLLEAVGTKRKLLNFVEKLTYRFSTSIYPNSKGLYEIIISEKYTKPEKLKVMGHGSSNGIDTGYFDPEKYSGIFKEEFKNEIGIPSKNFVFLFVGRLVKDKGINELVAVFIEFLKKHHNVSLLLVGPTEDNLDPLEETTKQQIYENPNIITTGFQNDVRPYFAISDCLVFPSYREGFPNVPLQAGAMGLPSIVTNINGCNEIVKHGHNGLIIPPKNAKAIEEAMVRMIKEKALTKKLASNARESIVSRFDQLTLWKLIKEEYDTQLRAAGINF